MQLKQRTDRNFLKGTGRAKASEHLLIRQKHTAGYRSERTTRLYSHRRARIMSQFGLAIRSPQCDES